VKILYVASRVGEAEALALESEITDVQRQLAEASRRSASIVFLPDTTIEALPLELSKHKPDVLHISVHGDRDGLWFAKQGLQGAKRHAHLTPARLFALLDADEPPRLVFLNACKSIEVAEYLAERGITAIGTSAPITNEAAVSASRLLYERLLGGHSVRNAFAAVEALVATMDDNRVALALKAPEGIDPATLRLHEVPRLAARLPAGEPLRPGKPVGIEFGVTGCPPDTCQVVFFTSDATFIIDDAKLERDLCEVIRDMPRRGEIWTEFQWLPAGNFRICACGVTAGGETFAVSAMAVDVLQRYARSANPSQSYEELLAKAVAHLHDNDGAGLTGWERDKSADPARSAKKRAKKSESSQAAP